jgi:hypothetical protein
MKKIFTMLFCLLICSGSGYKGKLPDINSEFAYIRTNPAGTKQIFNPMDEFESQPDYKKIPRENKTYIDIILKKDKTSAYIKDLNDIIPILEKMQKSIETQGSVQKFNAIASSIIDHADYIGEKYADKPEKYYISFSKLMSISAQARTVATLRCEAQVYIKYLAYQQEGQIYSKDNVQRQIEFFSEELKNTIRILKDST